MNKILNFRRQTTYENQERLRREEKIRSLIYDEDEDKLGRAYDSRLMKRLMSYLRPYRLKMTSAIILMTIASLMYSLSPWVIGRAIDDGIRAADITQLRFWTWVFVIVSVTQWLTNRARMALMAYVGTKAVADIRSALFRHLHQLTLNFFNNYSVGRLMSRLISDVQVLQDFITWAITGVTRSTLALVSITFAMFAMHWKLALVTFTVLIPMMIVTNYWRVHVRAAYRATRQRLALINGYLNESISGIRVTKSFTREPRNAAHFDDLNSSFFDANIEAVWLTAWFFPTVDFLGSLATALVVGFGGWLILADTLTAGVLVAFAFYIDRFFLPIRELAMRYNVFQAAMAASERIFGLLDTQPDLYDVPNAQPLPEIEGLVEYRQVSFSYKEGEPVLHHIDLRAEPGQRIALVGETGAGKSTIIRLLARFFDISEGTIAIDGHDISQVQCASLRRQLGVVLQDTFLFGGTLADNIRYGQLDATDEQIEQAARAVGAHDFIAAMPQGYQTEVGENGVNLSVGQRQLVSFARALLADPRILILDEATSSVDTTTEKQIERAMDHLMAGRTSFVIAHRLNTIVNADQIVVLDHGRIIEKGNHETLLAQKGRYYNLYTMQWAQPNEAG